MEQGRGLSGSLTPSSTTVGLPKDIDNQAPTSYVLLCWSTARQNNWHNNRLYLER